MVELDLYQAKEEPPLVQAAKEEIRVYLEGCRAGSPRIVALSDIISMGQALRNWKNACDDVSESFNHSPQNRICMESTLRMTEHKREEAESRLEYHTTWIPDYLIHYDHIEKLNKKLIMAYSESGEIERLVDLNALNDLIEIRKNVLYNACCENNKRKVKNA